MLKSVRNQNKHSKKPKLDSSVEAVEEEEETMEVQKCDTE